MFMVNKRFIFHVLQFPTTPNRDVLYANPAFIAHVESDAVWISECGLIARKLDWWLMRLQCSEKEFPRYAQQFWQTNGKTYLAIAWSTLCIVSRGDRRRFREAISHKTDGVGLITSACHVTHIGDSTERPMVHITRVIRTWALVGGRAKLTPKTSFCHSLISSTFMCYINS